MEGSKLFIDTNILVYSSIEDYDTDKHKTVLNAINSLNIDCEFYVSTQTLREFYAVVTNSKYLVKPMSPGNARNQIKFFHDTFNVLPITESVILNLLEIAEKYNIQGQAIHDTTIVATMIEYDIKNIFTFNVKDFKRFNEIIIIDPVSLST